MARSLNVKRVWLAGGSLLGLALGFVVGIWAQRTADPFLLNLSTALSPLGTMWGNALRMTVVPLVVAQIVCSLVAMRGGAGAVGRISGLSFVVFLLMLVIGGAVTVTMMPAILARLEFTPDALAAFRAAVPPGARPEAAAQTAGSWLSGLVPPNILRAAVQDDLIAMMMFAIAFGVAVRQMSFDRRRLAGDLFQIVADAMMTIVGWLLWLMPVGVFVLAMSTAARGGLGAAEVVITFVGLTCAVLLVWTLVQYPMAAALASVSVRRYASAMMPVQLVALSTRSSIACLPALVDAAQNRLGIRREVSSLVMPLAVSTFKFNRTISTTIQFLFLAHVYGVDLSMTQVATFMLAALVLSFSTLGIPSGGSLMRSAPLYVAAGIPIEGYLLVEAADAVPDMFKTLLNVTGNMTAVAIVNRLSAPGETVDSLIPEPTIEELRAGV